VGRGSQKRSAGAPHHGRTELVCIVAEGVAAFDFAPVTGRAAPFALGAWQTGRPRRPGTLGDLSALLLRPDGTVLH
jgi:hypothetical protein